MSNFSNEGPEPDTTGEVNPEQKVQEKKGWFFARQLPLESETAMFILANVMDIIVTTLLLQYDRFRESNAIAQWVIENFGVPGMITFKLSIVVTVCVIAQLVWPKRPNVARWLLIGGTVLVFGVVFYSFGLFVKHSGFYG